MKKYFYIQSGEQQGPYSLEELKGKQIEKSTPIWHEGLTDWSTAGALPELSSLFPALELPVYKQETFNEKPKSPQATSQTQITRNSPPKTWLVESILVTLFCCMPFGIAGIVFASKVESLYYAGDVAGAERASREAAKWTKIGFWIMGVIALLYVAYFVVVILFMAGSAFSH